MLKRLDLSKKHSVIYSILHQLLLAAYGFGILLLLYRFTSKEETGRWLLFVSSVSLADMILHGFLQTPVIRLLSEKGHTEESVKKILSSALSFSLIIWAIVSSILLLASFVVENSLLTDLRWYIALGFVMTLYNTGWWIHHALSDFRAIFLQRVVFVTVSILSLIAIYLIESIISLSGIVLSQIGGYLVSNLSLLILRKSFRVLVFKTGSDTIRYFLNYGKYTAGSMILGSLLRNADIFMIASFMGQGAVAIYGAAQKMIEFFEVALRGIAAHSLPVFCNLRSDFKSMMIKYRDVTLKLTLLFALPALLVFIFSDEVILLLSGSDKYLAASVVLKVFMVYIPFLITDRMTGISLEALGLAHFNFSKMIILMIFNLLGNFIALTYFHSLAAVAAASIVASLAGIITGWIFFDRYFKRLNPLSSSTISIPSEK